MAFHVGQRVVCIIQGKAPAFCPVAVYPNKGSVYTVREVRDDRPMGGSPEVILLCEIDNRHCIGARGPGVRAFIEPAFNSRGFRPLCESRLDQFRAHLTPTPKERVPA